MATVVYPICRAEGGAIAIELDYNDRTMVASVLRVINNAPCPCRVTITRHTDGISVTTGFVQPGTHTFPVSIPVSLIRSRLSGFAIGIGYPA